MTYAMLEEKLKSLPENVSRKSWIMRIMFCFDMKKTRGRTSKG